MNASQEFVNRGYVGSFKSEHYIHIMELPVNSLICNRWLMQAYIPRYQNYGPIHRRTHRTLEEIGKHDDQVYFALEQRATVPAQYGYRMHVRNNI